MTGTTNYKNISKQLLLFQIVSKIASNYSNLISATKKIRKVSTHFFILNNDTECKINLKKLANLMESINYHMKRKLPQQRLWA